MAMVTWGEEFSVKIQEIDDQHKIIVDLINELGASVSGGNDPAIVEHTIERLVEYTKVHFAIEEALMRIFRYPDYERHKQIHGQLLNRVLAFQKQYLKGNTQIGSELMYFLKDWLLNHIVKIDKGYSSHLLTHKIES